MIEVPDFAEPFVAWRVWRVVRKEGSYRLGSVVKRTLWPAGEPLDAQCLHSLPFLRRLARVPQHEAPAFRCDCGIYAAGLDRIGQYLADLPAPPAVARVVGEVSLWGDVVECERGFRASRAYPKRVYVPVDACGKPDSRTGELAEALEDAYRIPVELLPARCLAAPRMLALRELVRD